MSRIATVEEVIDFICGADNTRKSFQADYLSDLRYCTYVIAGSEAMWNLNDEELRMFLHFVFLSEGVM